MVDEARIMRCVAQMDEYLKAGVRPTLLNTRLWTSEIRQSFECRSLNEAEESKCTRDCSCAFNEA